MPQGFLTRPSFYYIEEITFAIGDFCKETKSFGEDRLRGNQDGGSLRGILTTFKGDQNVEYLRGILAFHKGSQNDGSLSLSTLEAVKTLDP